MEFDVEITGLGNLESQTLRVKPLTVIAGENSSGKSFATKSIYCVLDALNQNHVMNSLNNEAAKFMRSLLRYEYGIGNRAARVDSEFIFSARDSFEGCLSSMSEFLSNLDFLEQEKIKTELGEELQSLLGLQARVKEYVLKRSTLKKIAPHAEVLQEMVSTLERMIYAIRHHKELVVGRIGDQLSDNFKKNFQVTNLGALINNNSKEEAVINFENVGNLKFNSEDKVAFSFAVDGIAQIQKLQNVVFIDSPVYLRIRKGLEKKNFLSFPMKNERYLKGYPEYIDGLYAFVENQFIDKPDFADVSNEIQSTLSGKLNVTRAGDINYVSTEGVSTPLSLTAMGISNLGLIDLLIRNNVIKKGSFLIIDEPEAHIHPKWQVVLMELLYKMASAGANVIIATHSLDMVKKLELLAKQDDTAEKLISVHKMPGSLLEPDATLQEKISEVLEDLSTPFYQMYMEGLD